MPLFSMLYSPRPSILRLPSVGLQSSVLRPPGLSAPTGLSVLRDLRDLTDLRDPFPFGAPDEFLIRGESVEQVFFLGRTASVTIVRPRKHRHSFLNDGAKVLQKNATAVSKWNNRQKQSSFFDYPIDCNPT